MHTNYQQVHMTLQQHRDALIKLLQTEQLTTFNKQRLTRYLEQLNKMVSHARMHANFELMQGL